jgi:hypothetical protein
MLSETWSFIQKEEVRLMVSEKKVLRKIHEPKREEESKRRLKKTA